LYLFQTVHPFTEAVALHVDCVTVRKTDTLVSSLEVVLWFSYVT